MYQINRNDLNLLAVKKINMIQRTFLAVFLVISIVCITSCRKNFYNVKVSGPLPDIEILRLEKDLFEPDPLKINDTVPWLYGRYGTFLQLFSYVINAGTIGEGTFGEVFTAFCADRLNNEVYSKVIKAYPETENLEKDLEVAFRNYLWHFQGDRVPYIYTCITGFNTSIIVGDTAIGISLDRYLGRDSEYYPRLGIYNYISARMNSYNIVPDCMHAWGATEFPFDSAGYQADNLLSQMIHEGKLKYFDKCMLPLTADSVIFGFNAKQLNFCNNNEQQMWSYLVENDILFSSDRFLIQKLTGEAPFTSFFTNESPGRAAVWIGFRIVESYMKQNKNVKLPELMNISDVQAILEGAKYNPQ